ncbi:MAG: hypothetical protein FD123_149 [Bacteroidetes bacterium]|nr:MAG: hypothetical protein FD123_149 [Bacteroidota bacterium]
MRKFTRYFLQGLLVVVPVAITGLVLYKMVVYIGMLFGRFDMIVHPYADPIIFTVLLILLIFLVGLLATNYLARFFWREMERIFEKAPLVKIIYSSIKDFLSAFIGNKKRFNKPVLVTTNVQSNIQEMGFITQDDLTKIGLGRDKVAVYLPVSYSISGRLVIVPAASVQPLDIPSSDAMKFIVSGGVADVD